MNELTLAPWVIIIVGAALFGAGVYLIRRSRMATKPQFPPAGGKVPIKPEATSNKLPKKALHTRGRNRGMGTGKGKC